MNLNNEIYYVPSLDNVFIVEYKRNLRGYFVLFEVDGEQLAFSINRFKTRVKQGLLVLIGEL